MCAYVIAFKLVFFWLSKRHQEVGIDIEVRAMESKIKTSSYVRNINS